MPKRRRDNHINHTRSTRARRKYKARRKKTRKRATTLRIPNAFPDKAIVSHKYVCKGTFDPGWIEGSTKKVSFKANGKSISI